jgi:hypothetical protein
MVGAVIVTNYSYISSKDVESIRKMREKALLRAMGIKEVKHERKGKSMLRH